MIVLLDSNTLGLIAKPEKSFDEPADESKECQQWFYGLLSRGHRVSTSEICDYEVRRGLLSDLVRSKKTPPGLQILDALARDGLLEFLPVSKRVLVLAASLWAKAANDSQTTRSKENIDVDIIISAQCQVLESDFPGQQIIMATTNLKHLSRFCSAAANWQDINYRS